MLDSGARRLCLIDTYDEQAAKRHFAVSQFG
jgi:hypothetical protein